MARLLDAFRIVPANLWRHLGAQLAIESIVWSGDWGQLSETAFLRDFAGDLPVAKARVLYALQGPFESGYDVPFDRIRPLIGMNDDRMLPQAAAAPSADGSFGRR
jgi:hypothetical protein